MVSGAGAPRRNRPESQPLASTGELASVVRRAAGGRGWQRIDPATRTFQALRIWTNRELEGLEAFLESAARLVALGGRVVMPRTVLPDVILGLFEDPEGHTLGLVETRPAAAQ